MPDAVSEAKAIQKVIQAMLDRIASLEDLIGLGEDDVSLIMRCTGLTKTEAKMASMLRKRRVPLSKSAIHQALYGALPDCDQPAENVVTVNLTAIRTKLESFKIEIVTIYGAGYTMDEPSRQRLTAMMDAVIQTAEAA